jgi:hypothetical protein
VKQLRIVTPRLARGDRKWPLKDGQIPNFRGVRVALVTGYHRVEVNRRASRNGRVSDLPPETCSLTCRFVTFSIAVAVHRGAACVRGAAEHVHGEENVVLKYHANAKQCCVFGLRR